MLVKFRFLYIALVTPALIVLSLLYLTFFSMRLKDLNMGFPLEEGRQRDQ